MRAAGRADVPDRAPACLRSFLAQLTPRQLHGKRHAMLPAGAHLKPRQRSLPTQTRWSACAISTARDGSCRAPPRPCAASCSAGGPPVTRPARLTWRLRRGRLCHLSHDFCRLHACGVPAAQRSRAGGRVKVGRWRACCCCCCRRRRRHCCLVSSSRVILWDVGCGTAAAAAAAAAAAGSAGLVGRSRGPEGWSLDAPSATDDDITPSTYHWPACT